MGGAKKLTKSVFNSTVGTGLGLVNTGLGITNGLLGGGGSLGAVGMRPVEEKEKEIVRQAPATPVTQDSASNISQIGDEDDDEIIGGKRKSLSGVRKLTIPATASR